jgi:Holliday junction resolvasome RuvABC DNA-binding subunit
MVSYIIGKIVSLNKKSITIESNYTGYTVFVSDPTKYETGKIKKIYLFQNLSINNTKNKILEE